MSEINKFSDLNAWKVSHNLVLDIYRITEDFPKEEIYGITSQLRRAASSITANIAEGFSRFHFKDKTRFYYNARGSASEVQNFTILAKDLYYIDDKNCKSILDKSEDVCKLINGLIRSINNQK